MTEADRNRLILQMKSLQNQIGTKEPGTKEYSDLLSQMKSLDARLKGQAGGMPIRG